MYGQCLVSTGAAEGVAKVPIKIVSSLSVLGGYRARSARYLCRNKAEQYIFLKNSPTSAGKLMALMPSLNFNPDARNFSFNSFASFSYVGFGVISIAQCGAPQKCLKFKPSFTLSSTPKKTNCGVSTRESKSSNVSFSDFSNGFEGTMDLRSS